jgi:hypothetical protein
MSKKKGKNSNYKQYVEIRLNEDMGKPVIPHGYELDAKKKYIIELIRKI